MVIDITHFFLCVVRYCWLPCLFLVEVLCHRKDKNEDTFFITGELINKKFKMDSIDAALSAGSVHDISWLSRVFPGERTLPFY